MVVRVIFLILIFTQSAFANKCISCHESHYTDMYSCVECHRGNSKTSRKNIAHQNLITGSYASYKYKNADGERLAEKAKCKRCHLISGKGNSLAPDLSKKASERTAEELNKSVEKPTDYMPDFKFTSGQRVEIVKYLLSESGTSDIREPYTVFAAQGESNIFEEKCGGCHKLLTLKYGPMGQGEAGPNLSGIFSKYFQTNLLSSGESWSRGNILKWINNPRSINRLTIMPPVKINELNQQKIIDILSD